MNEGINKLITDQSSTYNNVCIVMVPLIVREYSHNGEGLKQVTKEVITPVLSILLTIIIKQ